MKGFQLTAAAALTFTSAAALAASLNPGTYETVGKGNNGEVVVKTTLSKNAITKIEVVKMPRLR